MAKKKFYAVVKGRTPGIYQNWDSCEKNIRGYSGAKHQSFSNEEDAIAWYRANGGDMALLSVDKNETVFVEDTVINKENRLVSCAEQTSDCGDHDDFSLVARLREKLDQENHTAKKIEDDLEKFCEKYPRFGNLSDAQKIAVQTITGKSLLFAVPGSGKTTVLIARTGYLLYGQQKFSIQPCMLMNLTFTVAAAREMADRFESIFNVSADELPAFRTIHSFCWSEILPLLKKEGFHIPGNLVNTDKQENQKAMCADCGDASDHSDSHERYSISQESEKNTLTTYSVLKAVLKHFKLSTRDETVREKISAVITYIKNRQLAPEEYADKIITIAKKEYALKEIFDKYQEELEKLDCMDFDDMLRYSLSGLQAYPDVLKKIRSKYSYWSIDEAQDNSKLQNELLSLLVGDSGNLFVVGDDDQSIYHFRGAEPDLLLRYGTSSNVRPMVMDMNYRSSTVIVDIAKLFIEENIHRADKQMRTRPGISKGNINFFINLPTEEGQYRHIVETARDCVEHGKSLAIIYRLNASAFPVMFWLKKHGIRFNAAKDYKELAWGKTFREVLSVMELAINPGSRDAFINCRFFLKIFLQKETLDKMNHVVEQGDHIENILDWVVDVQGNLSRRVIWVKDVLGQIRTMTVFDAARFIIGLFYEVQPPTLSAPERLREYAILSACAPYHGISDFLSAHTELLECFESDNLTDSNVTLTSMHSSKGLEFDHVIIIDAWENIMCRNQSRNENEIRFEDPEEARRLFYVAVTRARDTLDICCPQKYFGTEEEPSRFIMDLIQSYERYTDKSIQPLPKDMPIARYESIFHRPQIYYAVRFGYQKGIFDNWPDAERSVKGYSRNEYKKFNALQDAEKYLEGYVAECLSSRRLSSMTSNMQPNSFMKSVDIPEELSNSILRWFGVTSLMDISSLKIDIMKSHQIVYTDNQETDYHDRVDNYILVYMLVNFYKIWAPMLDLLKKKHLKSELKILELGAGPGTSAISLVYFYQLLAQDNSDIEFVIDYHAVERVPGFIHAFEHMMRNYLQSNNVANLEVNWKMHDADIYSFISGISSDDEYDIIFESNVLNGNENCQQKNRSQIASDLARKLAGGGVLIFVEPGKKENKQDLNRIRDLLFATDCIYSDVTSRKSKVFVDNISLLSDVKKLGLRNDKVDEHWFCYSLFKKRGK